MLALGMIASSLYAVDSEKAYHFSIGAGGWIKRGVSKTNSFANMKKNSKAMT